MESREIDTATEELLAWGVLERGEAGLALSRRFRAAFARAAMQLQGDEAAAVAGVRGTEALRRAAALALVTFPRPPGGVLRAEHATLIAAVELASLPDAVRDALGA